jgi:AhpD family alkylhydroperoxidase
LGRGVNASGLLDGQLKDLACLRAALINGCPF